MNVLVTIQNGLHTQSSVPCGKWMYWWPYKTGYTRNPLSPVVSECTGDHTKRVTHAILCPCGMWMYGWPYKTGYTRNPLSLWNVNVRVTIQNGLHTQSSVPVKCECTGDHTKRVTHAILCPCGMWMYGWPYNGWPYNGWPYNGWPPECTVEQGYNNNYLMWPKFVTEFLFVVW